jgi:hypothetical protein
LHADPASVTIAVKNGVAVITGPLEADRDLVAVAPAGMGVYGVVDVIGQRSA